MNEHLRTASPLQRVSRLGQSVWIDWLSRELLESGELQRLIAEHAVVGVTTNPTILERAIAATSAYDHQIRDLREFGLEPVDIFAELAATDVTEAALQLLPSGRPPTEQTDTSPGRSIRHWPGTPREPCPR
jgi:transaldolase